MKGILSLCLAFTFFSCTNNNKEKEEFYNVVNVVFNILTKETSPPKVVPPSFSEKNDSLSKIEIKNIEKISDSSYRKIIAIKLKLSDNNLQEIILKEYPDGFNNSDSKSQIVKLDSLDVVKIKSTTGDSIIKFHEDLLEPRMLDYLKFDKVIGFSPVTFYNDFKKASVLGTVSTSGLAGGAFLFFLEKKQKEWKVVKILEVEIF